MRSIATHRRSVTTDMRRHRKTLTYLLTRRSFRVLRVCVLGVNCALQIGYA